MSCLRMTKPYRGGKVTEESEGFHFNFETKSFLWKKEKGGKEVEVDKETNVLTHCLLHHPEKGNLGPFIAAKYK